MTEIKSSSEAAALDIKIKKASFPSGPPGSYTVWMGSSGVATIFTQEEADQWCLAYCRGYWNGKRQAFVDILEATETRLGGFY